MQYGLRLLFDDGIGMAFLKKVFPIGSIHVMASRSHDSSKWLYKYKRAGVASLQDENVFVFHVPIKYAKESRLMLDRW